MVLIIGFFVFLFSLFLLSRDDFVFLRKNISLNQIFDIALLTLLVALLISRIFFVASHPSTRFLNPLVFFIIPYFPGLSLAGAAIGGISFVFAVARYKRLPAFRILDIFFLSFLFALTVGFAGNAGMQFFQKHMILGIAYGVISIVGLFITGWVDRGFLTSSWKDGTASYLASITFVLLIAINVAIEFFLQKHVMFLPEIVLTVLFFISMTVITLVRRSTK